MLEFVAGLIVGSVLFMILFARWLSDESQPKPTTELWYGLVPCSHCIGSGKKDNQICEICKGEGLMPVYLDIRGRSLKGSRMVKKEDRDNLYKQGRKILVECISCGGSGAVHEGFTYSSSNPRPIFGACDYCEGTGSILRRLQLVQGTWTITV